VIVEDRRVTNRLLYLVRHAVHEKDPDSEAADGNENGVLTEVGVRQAKLLGERLREVPFEAVHHSSLRRAAQTAELLAEFLPGVPVRPSDLLRECIPMVPERHLLTPPQVEFFDGWPQAILDHGRAQAAAAVERFAGVRASGRPEQPEQPELLVSHGNLISWFVCEALDVPRWRWLSLPLHYNCALTIILYREGRPPTLVSYNDMGHLPPSLRGTDYPDEFRV